MGEKEIFCIEWHLDLCIVMFILDVNCGVSFTLFYLMKVGLLKRENSACKNVRVVVQCEFMAGKCDVGRLI